MAQDQGLVAMPTDWERSLVIVAHPDDVEYGMAGAVAQWTDEGRSVAYLLATRGEAGIDGMPPEEAGPLREREQVAAATVVGVHQVEFLDHTDGVIEYGLPLRRDIASAVRRYQPELVVTLNYRESWPHGGLNMADHRHLGLAALDGVRDAGNRWVFPELLDRGEMPWPGVRWIAIGGSSFPTHAVDITNTIDRAVDSLREHHAYLAGLGEVAGDPDTFLRANAAETGRQFGGGLACAFELLTP